MKKRPVDLNPLRVQLPWPARLSILHRVAGAAWYLALPALLLLWQASVSSSEGFARAQEWLAAPVLKVPLLVLVWFFWHHFFAGLRYLLLDLHIGVERDQARKSSLAVFGLAVAATVATGVKLW